MRANFCILGEPQGKGRPRFSTVCGHVKPRTPEETVLYENLVKTEYRRQTHEFRFPDDAMLDVRVIAYYSIPKSVSKKKRQALPEIRAAASMEEATRHDDIGDLVSIVQQSFLDMGVELDNSTHRFGLREKVERMAHLTRKLTIKEWKRAIRATLGIDILDDYYLGEFYREALTRWVDQNVNLIKTIPKSTLGDMQNIVLDGFRNGRSTKSIIQEIQDVYGQTKRHARLIARDQIGKLNGELTKKQQEDAGVEEYEWSDSGDGRVRDSHKHLNKKRFRWSDPPIVDAKTGRRCHPGQDYQCRCVALPVFDIETIDLPFAGKGGKSA